MGTGVGIGTSLKVISSLRRIRRFRLTSEETQGAGPVPRRVRIAARRGHGRDDGRGCDVRGPGLPATMGRCGRAPRTRPRLRRTRSRKPRAGRDGRGTAVSLAGDGRWRQRRRQRDAFEGEHPRQVDMIFHRPRGPRRWCCSAFCGFQRAVCEDRPPAAWRPPEDRSPPPRLGRGEESPPFWRTM